MNMTLYLKTLLQDMATVALKGDIGFGVRGEDSDAKNQSEEDPYRHQEE